MKTALQIAKNGDPEDRKDKVQTWAERIRALQSAQKTAPQEKRWVEDGSGKERENVALRREKLSLQKRKQPY